MSTSYTAIEGQYLAFIANYQLLHGSAPAEADMQRFFGTTPPTVHQTILRLEKKGFISRIPGKARSIKLLISEKELPELKRTT
jgi:DNA-binding MarR family transcriptional regulator